MIRSAHRMSCRRGARVAARWGVVLALACTLGAMPGCNRNKRKPPPRPRQAETRPLVIRDIPAPLRGTIGAEATIRGVQPTLISGIGFVVGLNGTGGLTLPEIYAAHLEREMGLNGVSASNRDMGAFLSGRSPRELLRDPNTAAVIIQAAMPPGGNEGDSFDVYVRAINATSLEGGILWTTDLRIGPPSAFGDPQARILAKARGPIFLNPFAEPGSQETGVRRTVGRVLDGGTVTFPTLIEVILDNPSHQRARQIASAINAAFPRGPGDPEQMARGKDEALIQVRVPQRYNDRREDFVELVRHLPIDQSFPEAYARRFGMAMSSDPYLARELSWGLEAIGERSKPFLVDLYDAPEVGPRLAALRAGARLNDPRAVKALRDIAVNGSDSLRTDAILLLSQIDGGPAIDDTLRSLLESPMLSVRVEAYEGLMRRAVESQKRRLALAQARSRNDARIAPTGSRDQIEAFARSFIPAGTLYGVSRELVEGKFFLDRVPFGEPLIYVTQQGEPRIVVFGEDPELVTPMLVTAWTDRLMLASDAPGEPIRLYYRDDSLRRTVTMEDTPTDLAEFVRFLARDPTPGDPTPGLGLSYAEVVGALYALNEDRGTRAAFATENDRLLAELLQTAQPGRIEVRPEAPGDEVTLIAADDPSKEVVDRSKSGLVRERRSLLVPVNPPAQQPPPGSENGDAPAPSGQQGAGNGAPEPIGRRE